MEEFDKIFLSWRKGQGTGRFIVGVIEKDINGTVAFKYDSDQVNEAKKEGFPVYTEFPDISQIYTENVLDIFSQRIIKSERHDIQKFYDFWEIDAEHYSDKFYLLGHTQGLLPSDNYEFLADYNPVNKLHFLTDLASLSIQRHPSDIVKNGDELIVRFESDNHHDKDAVAVYKGNDKIGYIKKIHCRVFNKAGGAKLKVKIKSIDKNGILKRVFVKVYQD